MRSNEEAHHDQAEDRQARPGRPEGGSRTEWIAIGLGLLLILCWTTNKRSKEPKVETLEEARSRHVYEKADVDADNLGVPPDLLRDLGAMVYFGAMRQVVRDKKQATLPTLWSAQYTRSGADGLVSTLGAFGERLCQKIRDLPESNERDMKHQDTD